MCLSVSHRLSGSISCFKVAVITRSMHLHGVTVGEHLLFCNLKCISNMPSNLHFVIIVSVRGDVESSQRRCTRKLRLLALHVVRCGHAVMRMMWR